MKTLSETLNEFYGCKPTQWSSRDYEEEDFGNEIKNLPFKPKAFVVFSETHRKRRSDYVQSIHEWCGNNVRGAFAAFLTSEVKSPIYELWCFQDEADAAIFKLTWC